MLKSNIYVYIVSLYVLLNLNLRLADFVEQEPERKRKQKEQLKAKIEEGLKEREPKKIRFDDLEFVKDHEKNLEDVKDAVSKGNST
jgi:hypothetical protein